MSRFPEGFGGIVPPVSTPLTEEGEVDVASLRRLLSFLLDAGVSGVFLLGSTGEAAFLTDAQRAVALDTAVGAVAGRVPVLAGVFDMTTARAREHAQAAERAGVDALVLTAPFYTRTSQPEIVEHFRAVAATSALPLFAYDIPVAVHTKLERETVLRLAREGLIAGVKDSSGDEANFRGLVLALRDAAPGVAVFTGSELVVDAALLMGADGAVPGLANVDPHGYVRLFQAARAGDWQAARREQERLYQLFNIVSVGLQDTPPRMGSGSSAMGGFKTALQLRGIIATNVTGRPQLRLNAVEVARVRQTLERAGLMETSSFVERAPEHLSTPIISGH